MAVIDVIANAVETTLTPAIEYKARKKSSVFRRIVVDSSQVEGLWGTDWAVTKLFSTGLAGGFTAVDFNAGTPSLAQSGGGTPNFQIFGTGLNQTWPGQSELTQPAYFQYKIGLQKGRGNLTMSTELRRTEQLTAVKAKILQDIVERCGEKVALTMINMFLSENSTLTDGTNTHYIEGGRIGKIAATYTLANGAGTTITLSGGAIARFKDGQEVDIFHYDASAAALIRKNASTTPVWVSSVNALKDTLKLVNNTGSALGITLDTNDQAFIVVRGAWDNFHTTLTAGGSLSLTNGQTYLSRIPYSIERIAKASGFLYGTGNSHDSSGTGLTGGIDLARFPDYTSYVQSVGSAIDERLLFDYHARMEHAGFEGIPDQYIGSEGVISALTDNLDGTFTWERNGDDVSLNLGYSDIIAFNAFGKRFRVVSDSYIGAGKLYGMMTANNNWKRHVPPRMPNSPGKPGYDKGVEFRGRSLSFPDIFVPVHNSSGVLTDALQCPFDLPYQILPDVPNMTYLYDITESYGPVNA